MGKFIVEGRSTTFSHPTDGCCQHSWGLIPEHPKPILGHHSDTITQTFHGQEPAGADPSVDTATTLSRWGDPVPPLPLNYSEVQVLLLRSLWNSQTRTGLWINIPACPALPNISRSAHKGTVRWIFSRASQHLPAQSVCQHHMILSSLTKNTIMKKWHWLCHCQTKERNSHAHGRYNHPPHIEKHGERFQISSSAGVNTYANLNENGAARNSAWMSLYGKEESKPPLSNGLWVTSW